jgi:hypothetical protein
MTGFPGSTASYGIFHLPIALLSTKMFPDMPGMRNAFPLTLPTAIGALDQRIPVPFGLGR